MGKLIDFLRERMGPHWGGQVAAWVIGPITGLVLVCLCAVLGQGDWQGFGRNVLLCVVSAIFGWIVGIFFSPFDKEDQERLKYVGKAVTAFVSGYLLSTFQPIIAKYIDQVKEGRTAIPWNEVGLATASFLVVAVVVFVSRSYALRDDIDKREQAKKVP